MRRARLSFWLAAGLLPLLAAGAACREVQEALVWPDDTAALVDGRPITMAELNQVLGWGFYGQLNREEGASEGGPSSAPETVPRLVLEKMIEERLVLAEAVKRRVSLEAAERELSAAWPDEAELEADLPQAQAEILRRNLVRQFFLHKVTARIMAEERRFSEADWQAFWREWPRKKPTRYLVRVLFLPSSPEAPVLPEPSQGNLEQLTQRFKLEGYPAILSAPVWLQSDFLESDLLEILETAWADRKPSPPVRQEGSWAVYEVLDLDRKTAVVAELKAARAAYELKTGEEAFRVWLAARRAEADIRINPSLTQSRE